MTESKPNIELPTAELIKLRHYYAIWNRIKHRDRCILHIDPSDLRRFKKAISKEKGRDQYWNKRNKKKLVFTETGDRDGKYVLIVTLQIYVGLESIL